MNISVDLIRRCKLKDRQAQRTLYLQLLPYLRAVCQRYIYKKSDIKDALQESFVLIFNNIEKYHKAKGGFKSWAVKVTINTTINYNQRVSIQNEDEFQLSRHDISTEPEVYQNMLNEELKSLLFQMPKNYADVFNLFVIDCYTHDEIANLLKIEPQLSRKRLSRARFWLKKAMVETPKKSINLKISKSS